VENFAISPQVSQLRLDFTSGAFPHVRYPKKKARVLTALIIDGTSLEANQDNKVPYDADGPFL
jgi:hypothetical protein